MTTAFFARAAAALMVLGATAACDADRPVPAEPGPTESPTSIIREGFEEPVPEVIQLAPLDARIGFGDGKLELSESAIADLETLLVSPQVKMGGPITLRAHSDSGGSGDGNMRASQQRGEAVRDWLVERGVAEERIRLVAFGEQNPIEPNALPDGSPNEAGRALNRRVDIHVGLEAQREETVAEQFDEEAAAQDRAAAAAQDQTDD